MAAKKKGQMVFEFLISAVIFFGIILYILILLNRNIVVYSSDFYTNDMGGRAVQISELLIKTKGVWSGGIPTSIGLASEYPVLNSTKISYLSTLCSTESGYADIQQKLDLAERPFLIEKPFYNMKIQINTTGSPSSVLLDCYKPSLSYIPENTPSANVERFSLSENNEGLKINVWVW